MQRQENINKGTEGVTDNSQQQVLLEDCPDDENIPK